ncbi:MAG: hypothetical protein P8010_22380, partial [Desulfosarcinaceae bacterium]
LSLGAGPYTPVRFCLPCNGANGLAIHGGGDAIASKGQLKDPRTLLDDLQLGGENCKPIQGELAYRVGSSALPLLLAPCS